MLEQSASDSPTARGPRSVLLAIGDGARMSTIQSALRGTQIVTAADWDQMRLLLTHAACGIVLSPWLRESNTITGILELRASATFAAIVLITQYHPENVRSLKDIIVHELVWTNEIAHELAPALARARASAGLGQLATRLESALLLPTSLRRALALACRATAPIKTVSALAQVCGCDRKKLSRQWAEVVGSGAAVRLEDVVHWIWLLRVLALKSPLSSWEDTAQESGAHVQTIGRRARRLLGNSPAQLARIEPAALLQGLVRALQPLWTTHSTESPAQLPTIAVRRPVRRQRTSSF